jgi:hypothetical protein
MNFLSPSRQILGYYLRLGHDHIHSNLLLTSNPAIWAAEGIGK